MAPRRIAGRRVENLLQRAMPMRAAMRSPG
jgi:hypothetical protein